jgi:thiamine biosynthesis lipoprotein
MAVVEFRGRVMASRLHVIAVGDGEAAGVDAAVHDAVSHLEHLERCWSRFVATSDISRINQLGPSGAALGVDPSTLTLLATMIEGYEVTAGRFDPTVLPALIAEGYAASLTDPAAVSSVALGERGFATLHELALDPSTDTVTVPGGLALDPGGVGKGLAADLAVARLLASGAAGAMVEIGGDLVMGGASVDPAGWLVDVEHPDPCDGVACALAVSGGGVATSSVCSRRWVRDGVVRHHQIDPATSACSDTDLLAVTVFARAGWLAEVHATGALATGTAGVISYLEGHSLSGIAFGAFADGRTITTTQDLAGIAFTSPSGVR